jgi:hypothetical protein
MTKQDEFIKQIQTVLRARNGAIVGASILKNNLAKLNKDVASITADDGKILIENIIKAVLLFGTTWEANLIKAELEKSLSLLS